MLINNSEVIENLNKEVDARFYLREYDEVLTGNRNNYSSACMSKSNGGRLIAEILDYIFSYYIRWTPTQVRDCLTPEIVKALHLESFIKRIPCPPEVLPKKGELYYVAWYIYSETKNASRIDLIIKVYMDVLHERITKFPKGYFDGNDGYSRARILLLTMIREFYSFESQEEMYSFFASDAGRRAIHEHKLGVPLRELYSSALDYLHDALGEKQGSHQLYMKYHPLVRERINRGYVDVASKSQYWDDIENDDKDDDKCNIGVENDIDDKAKTEDAYLNLFDESQNITAILTRLRYNSIPKTKE